MIPFWSLNDRLEEAELTEQIQRMHEVGIDGFFLHARGGLETAYMSEEWIARMETCIRKADELGMQAWLYDENGWPSGFADGAVPARDVRYQQKKLKWIGQSQFVHGVTSDQPPVYVNLHMESHTMPRYRRMYTVHTGRHFTVGGLPQRVHTADLTAQGLWFFAGEAGLTQTLCVQKQNDVRYEVRLTALYAPAARVFVNGEDAGELAFAPFVLDVTPFVKDGENTVEIRLYSGLRNLLGPHHIPVGDHWVTSPGNFTTFDVYGRDNRGLGWTDDYRFARFGFEG